jgi:hypothetical protein
MMNPSDNPQDPIAPSMDADNEFQNGWRDPARAASTSAGGAWQQAKDRAVTARERTELFLRENPIPTVLGALAVGLAIGLAIRFSQREEEEIEVKTPLGEMAGALSLPFLWPFFKTMKRRAEDVGETVTDAVKSSVDRVKDIDVHRYVKPMRKRWKSWTH